MDNSTRQAGIKSRKDYLVALRAFFAGAGLCGVGGALKNRFAMSSIVNGCGVGAGFGFCGCMMVEVSYG
jgi:hypothetical protein